FPAAAMLTARRRIGAELLFQQLFQPGPRPGAIRRLRGKIDVILLHETPPFRTYFRIPRPPRMRLGANQGLSAAVPRAGSCDPCPPTGLGARRARMRPS